jgi:hypothetical protein
MVLISLHVSQTIHHVRAQCQRGTRYFFLRCADFFFEKYSTNIDTHTRTSTQPYKHMHAHPTSMSTSERLSWFDLKIHEIDYQECLTIDEYVVSH